MFWQKKSDAAPSHERPPSAKPIVPTDHPGYYPGFRTLDQQKFWDAATRKLVLERVAIIPPIRFFSSAEAATMAAVVSRILPQEDRTEKMRIPILPQIDDRLFNNRLEGYRYEDMPPDQEAYRIAIKAIEAMAQEVGGTEFAKLTTMQQEEILQSLHDDKPIAAKAEWSQLNLKRFWSMLVTDCCTVYYAHPYAWDEIGFGGPAYPRGYMRLEEGEPEPWEVDEQRYEWAAPSDTLSGAEEPHGTGAEHQTHHGQGGTH
jgi:hypothetical protein